MADEETGGVFASGFEDETDSFNVDFTGKVEGGSDTITVQTSIKNHGSKAAAITWATADTTTYFYKTLSDMTDIYTRIYFYLGASWDIANNWETEELLSFWDGATRVVHVKLGVNDGTPHLIRITCKVRNPATTIYEASYGSISKETWYYFELRWVAGSGADGGAEFWLGGSSMASNYTLDQSSLAIDGLRIGAISDQSEPHSAGAITYVDDVKVDTSYIGAYSAPGRTTKNIRNADGTLGINLGIGSGQWRKY